MKPVRDWDDTGDAEQWVEELDDWKAAQRDARNRQDSDRKRLEGAVVRLGVFRGWLNTLTDAVNAVAAARVGLAAVDADLASADTALAALSGDIADHDEAREIATARVLGGPSTATPIVLVPLRLETHWDAGTLVVRIYPDVVNVDSHDTRLTDRERAAGDAYWDMRAGGGDGDAQQAWENLVRQTGAPRAAWVARAADPATAGAGAPAPRRDSPWQVAVNARLLPSRFAVIAHSAGMPINLAAAGEPPRYVTWSKPVADPLEIEVMHEPRHATWMTDPAVAEDAGMAVRIAVPDGAPAIDELVVVGVRDSQTPAAELADLLVAHAFADGLEILPDRTPTNNSDEVRASHSPQHDADVARGLLDAADAPDPTSASAGAQLADALGFDPGSLAGVAGADGDRRSAEDAMSLIVGLAADGPLRAGAGPAAAPAWPLLRPAGPVPALRIGRQPYGILPATAPARWQAKDGELTAPLAATLQNWGHARGLPVDVDPADPPTPAPEAYRITRSSESALHDVLLQAPSSLTFTDDNTTYTGLDGLIGPSAGNQAAGTYLGALAGAADSELDAVAATLPPTLLARVGLAARRRAADTDHRELASALGRLGARAVPDGGRAELARLLAESLDALSHRRDPWLTAACSERLANQRQTPAGQTALGAYGYLTDVTPRSEPRSHGHVHAPSLSHAATAAVLRSGFLGQRKAAWATNVKQAAWLASHAFTPRERSLALIALRDAQAGLAELRPLPDEQERALPLAIELSSQRVREARWVLAAVRRGEPLAAVLGYQFERDLADAGLQQYTAAFRKLTRFAAGTRLEALESARRTARDALADKQTQLTQLQADAAATQPAVDAALGRLNAARAALQQGRVAAAPYLQMQAERADLAARIPDLQAALDDVDNQRPSAGVVSRRINVP